MAAAQRNTTTLPPRLTLTLGFSRQPRAGWENTHHGAQTVDIRDVRRVTVTLVGARASLFVSVAVVVIPQPTPAST